MNKFNKLAESTLTEAKASSNVIGAIHSLAKKLYKGNSNRPISMDISRGDDTGDDIRLEYSDLGSDMSWGASGNYSEEAIIKPFIDSLKTPKDAIKAIKDIAKTVSKKDDQFHTDDEKWIDGERWNGDPLLTFYYGKDD